MLKVALTFFYWAIIFAVPYQSNGHSILQKGKCKVKTIKKSMVTLQIILQTNAIILDLELRCPEQIIAANMDCQCLSVQSCVKWIAAAWHLSGAWIKSTAH